MVALGGGEGKGGVLGGECGGGRGEGGRGIRGSNARLSFTHHKVSLLVHWYNISL